MQKTENQPAVSVIIPTYNRAHMIGRSIRSVLNQTYQDFEIIVIDDASIDDTEELILGLDDEKIRFIRHEKNKGAAAARNTGIKAARGNYIAFQDSDDEWLPEKLEKQIKVFETAPLEVGIVYSDMWRPIGTKKEYFNSPDINPEDGIIYEQALDYGIMNIGIQSALLKRECFAKVGGFDEKLPRLIDCEFFISLSRYYLFYHINEALVNYFDTQGSISSDNEALITARKLILKKYFDDIKKNKRCLSNHYRVIGFILDSNSDFKDRRDYFLNAIKVYPFNRRLILHTLLSFFGKRIYNKVLNDYGNLISKINTFLNNGIKRVQ